MVDYSKVSDADLMEMFNVSASDAQIVDSHQRGVLVEQVRSLIVDAGNDPDDAEDVAQRLHDKALGSLVDAIAYASEAEWGSPDEKAELCQRIEDWLVYGDMDASATVESLAAEWDEYDNPDD